MTPRPYAAEIRHYINAYAKLTDEELLDLSKKPMSEWPVTPRTALKLIFAKTDAERVRILDVALVEGFWEEVAKLTSA